MQEHVRIFVFGVSLVVYGSATAIRGLVVGDASQIVAGLFVLSVVLLTNLAEPRLRKGASGRNERRLRSIAATYPRWRRVLVVLFVLLVCDSVIRCIVSAVDGRWGDCIFYVVTGIAAVGVLVGGTGPLPDLRDEDAPEVGDLTTP
jgi:hypothetical protein